MNQNNKVKRKKLFPLPVYIILALFLTATYMLFFSSQSGTSQEEASSKANTAQNSSLTSMLSPDKLRAYEEGLVRVSESFMKDEELLSWEELKSLALVGRINLVSKLWEIRRLCPKGSTPVYCDQIVETFINERYPPPANTELLELFHSYQKYEERSKTEQQADGLSLNEKYETVREIRKQMFSSENHKLLFGFEESSYDYHNALTSLLNEKNSLSGFEKEEKWKDLQTQMLDEYKDAYLEQQEPFDQYQIAEKIFDNEINSENGSALRQKIREDYFGADAAKRMSAVDAQLEQEKQKITDYEKVEQAFLINNEYLSDQEREESLMQLRIEHLGKDAAEEYTRRKSLEARR